MGIGDNLLEISGGQADALLAWMSQIAFITQIVTIVIGLLVCFLGLKLLRVLSAISGLALGAGIGTAAAIGFHFSGSMIPVTILICAIILAVLAGAIRKMGAFLMVLLYTAGIGASLILQKVISLPEIMIAPESVVSTGIIVSLCVSAAAALLMAILALIWTEPVTVVVTGISGGLSAGTAAAVLIGMNGNVWLGYVIGAVFALIGICTQFMMQSRKIGKKEKVYSRQMKEQVSRESEVEKARRILEEDDDEDGAGKEESEDSEEEDDITIISEEL